jgi:hypothetical protein
MNIKTNEAGIVSVILFVKIINDLINVYGTTSNPTTYSLWDCVLVGATIVSIFILGKLSIFKIKFKKNKK